MSIAFDAENEDLSWPPRLLQKRRSRLPERRRFAVASSELSPDRTKEAARAAGDKRRAFPLSERSVLAQRAPNNSLDPFAHSFITQARGRSRVAQADRKSTRLNSSHGSISYAVFCLKKKKNT